MKTRSYSQYGLFPTYPNAVTVTAGASLSTCGRSKVLSNHQKRGIWWNERLSSKPNRVLTLIAAVTKATLRPRTLTGTARTCSSVPSPPNATPKRLKEATRLYNTNGTLPGKKTICNTQVWVGLKVPACVTRGERGSYRADGSNVLSLH
jgi:hypothetical protein